MSTQSKECQENLRVRVKHVYGVKTVYPACEKSKLLCELIGSKSLTARSKRIIEKLGYSFSVVPESLDNEE